MEPRALLILNCSVASANWAGFCQDEDLIVEAVKRQRAGGPFATVVFARQMELSIGRCITDLEAVAKAALLEDAQGQIIFL